MCGLCPTFGPADTATLHCASSQRTELYGLRQELVVAAVSAMQRAEETVIAGTKLIVSVNEPEMGMDTLSFDVGMAS